MQSLQFKILLLSVFVARFALTALGGSEFVAAVFEHAFIRAENTTAVLTQQEALAIVMRNMDEYKDQMKRAKEQNANIIVFPEYGLTGFGYTRESFRPFLENIPNPKNINWNACEDPQANISTPIMHRLSCLAESYNMFLVVNMGDIKPCNKNADQHCPTDGRYQYNTNVVFDNKGKLVARYHKQHPFLNEMKVVDRPLKPEYITFDTPFGKFGTFICFDILFHDPAVPLIAQYKIDHVVFPTAWFDVLPLFSAIGFHESWARGMEVNFLSANTHVPQYLNTGSGIYSPTGAKKYYRNLSANGSLSVATLQKIPRSQTHDMSLMNTENRRQMNTGEDSFYSDVFGDLFLFKELSKPEDSLSICYNESDICCTLTYKMTDKRADEMYAIGVFDGLHTREGQYYLRTCALIKCHGLSRDSCGQRTYEASTIFQSFTLQSQLKTLYVYPQVVADGVSLLPGEWDHNMPVTRLQSKQRLSKGLLTGALFGRVYELDDDPTSTIKSCASRVPSYRILVFLLTIKTYFHL